jgi:hypothetical protein
MAQVTALNRWYAEHFGVAMIESRGYEDPGLVSGLRRDRLRGASTARDPGA